MFAVTLDSNCCAIVETSKYQFDTLDECFNFLSGSCLDNYGATILHKGVTMRLFSYLDDVEPADISLAWLCERFASDHHVSLPIKDQLDIVRAMSRYLKSQQVTRKHHVNATINDKDTTTLITKSRPKAVRAHLEELIKQAK